MYIQHSAPYKSLYWVGKEKLLCIKNVFETPNTRKTKVGMVYLLLVRTKLQSYNQH